MISAAVNGFWVGVGVVAGALVQYGLEWLRQSGQRANAKRLLRIEADINRLALKRLADVIAETKEYALANELAGRFVFFDMSGFNYRLSDPLIGTGHFHDILGSEGVIAYFKFAQELNIANAQNLKVMFDQEVQEGKPLTFLNWLANTKLPEWDASLDVIERNLTR